jgi:hypothetical protein
MLQGNPSRQDCHAVMGWDGNGTGWEVPSECERSNPMKKGRWDLHHVTLTTCLIEPSSHEATKNQARHA